MKMKIASVITLAGLITLTLAGCSSLITPTPTTAPPTATLPTTAVAGYSDCWWNWARQPLPDLSRRVQDALDATGIAGASVYVEAYGENCYDGESNAVQYFAAMETDFYVTLPVEDLEDIAALGELVEGVLAVLDGFPPQSTPGPQPGRVSITLVAGETEGHLSFGFAEVAKARKRGLSGATLLQALGYGQ